MSKKNVKAVFEWAISNGDANIVDRIIAKLLPELLRREFKLTRESVETSEAIEVDDALYERIKQTAEELVGKPAILKGE